MLCLPHTVVLFCLGIICQVALCIAMLFVWDRYSAKLHVCMAMAVQQCLVGDLEIRGCFKVCLKSQVSM